MRSVLYEAKREGNELGEIGYSFRGEIKTHVQVANLNPTCPFSEIVGFNKYWRFFYLTPLHDFLNQENRNKNSNKGPGHILNKGQGHILNLK